MDLDVVLGQFFIRNSPQTLGLLDAVARTDLAMVKAWWDPERYGLFTNGDQDAFVYQLQGPGSDWGARFLQMPAMPSTTGLTTT